MDGKTRETTKGSRIMAGMQESLDAIMGIDGAIGAALADYSSGTCLGSAGGSEGFNFEVAAAGNSEVVRAKLRVMEQLGLADGIENILVSLGKEYHLIFPLEGTDLFVYAALRREQANLALTRHRMASIAKDLAV